MHTWEDSLGFGAFECAPRGSTDLVRLEGAMNPCFSFLVLCQGVFDMEASEGSDWCDTIFIRHPTYEKVKYVLVPTEGYLRGKSGRSTA